MRARFFDFDSLHCCWYYHSSEDETEPHSLSQRLGYQLRIKSMVV